MRRANGSAFGIRVAFVVGLCKTGNRVERPCIPPQTPQLASQTLQELQAETTEDGGGAMAAAEANKSGAAVAGGAVERRVRQRQRSSPLADLGEDKEAWRELPPHRAEGDWAAETADKTAAYTVDAPDVSYLRRPKIFPIKYT